MRKVIIFSMLFLVINANQSFSQSRSSVKNYDEIQLRRFVVSYLFYHYGLNNLCRQPIRIIDKYLYLKMDENEPLQIPLKDLNYIYCKLQSISDTLQILIFDIYPKPIDHTDSSVSLMGDAKLFFHKGEPDSTFIEGASFYNSIFKDFKITHDELTKVLGREPNLFSSLEDAYKAILSTLPLIKRCEGGAKIIEGGILMCPDSKTHKRTLLFNELKTVKIMDFSALAPETSPELKENLYLFIGFQVNEEARLKGDSGSYLPLYEIPRQYATKAYSLEDALIYMATY